MRYWEWVTKHWLFSFLLGIVVFGLLCMFVIVKSASSHNKKEMRLRREAFEKRKSDDPGKASHDKEAFEYLLTRESMYYVTYFRWQALSKIFGILSVFLSIGTLALSYELTEDSAANWQTTIISLFTTAFVVFTLYMKPDKKSREYIKAWRKCNLLVNSILYNKATLDNVASELEKIENNLPSDED